MSASRPAFFPGLWLALPLLTFVLYSDLTLGEDWLRFRGPNGSGVSESAAPVEFGENQNMKWQLELPGRGVSSPIVVNDKVFVTCYSGYGMGDDEEGKIEDLKRHLVCVDRSTGETLWTATEPAAQPEDPYTGMGVPSHGYASHTPTSDGERVFAFFGKSGVFAYDMEGNKLWHQPVGTDSGDKRWGSSSSPILSGDLLVVLASDESESLFGFDTKTGEQKWKTTVGGFANVWGTPAIADGAKGKEIVVAVPGETWGLNPENGKMRWAAPGNGGGSHSIVIADGFAISIGGSRSGASGVAIKLGGQGEIEEAAWERDASSRFATPLAYDGRIYAVDGDIVACYDAATGDELFEKRLPAKFTGGGDGGGRRGRRGGRSYASPVVAGGKIYVIDVGGTIYVLAANAEFEVVAKNDFSFDTSGFNATPAVSDGDLFLRSNRSLYCVGQ